MLGNNLLQIPITWPGVPPQVDTVIKITGVAIAVAELIREWWKESRRLATVKVRCAAHQEGTPDHANTCEMFEGIGRGNTYLAARKAAINDAEAKIVTKLGKRVHAQHCHDMP